MSEIKHIGSLTAFPIKNTCERDGCGKDSELVWLEIKEDGESAHFFCVDHCPGSIPEDVYAKAKQHYLSKENE